MVSSTAAQYAAIAAHQRLMQFGIFVDNDGQIEITPVKAAEYAASPWQCDLPLEGHPRNMQVRVASAI